MIKGEIKIIVRNAETGEVVREQQQTNTVTTKFLDELTAAVAGTSSTQRFGNNIVIGTYPQTTNQDINYIQKPAAIGFVEPGVTSPRVIEPVSGDTYIEYQNRFNPPATPRTIETIGIAKSSALPTGDNPSEVQAYVGLTTACPQATNETIDIFYRVIFVEDLTPGINKAQYNTFLFRAMHPSHPSHQVIHWPTYFSFSPVGSKYQVLHDDKETNNLEYGRLTNANSPNGLSGQPVTAGYTLDARHSTRSMNLDMPLGTHTGKVVNTISYNSTHTDGRELFRSTLLPIGSSKVQNTYPHNSAATTPFFSALTSSTGAGTLTIDDSSYTDPDYEKLTRVDITTTGALGVSEYQYSVRAMCGGFRLSNYEDHIAPISFINPSTDNTDLFNGATTGSDPRSSIYGANAISTGDNKNIIVYDLDWFSKVNIVTGVVEKFDATTTPAFTGTDISALVVTPSGDLWVSCLNTGVHFISADNTTITTFDTNHTDLAGLSSDACMSVTRTSNKIWAAFDGGLAYTSNGGVTWTIRDALSTPAYTVNNNDVRYIHGDPTHVDDRLMVVTDSNGGHTNASINLTGTWWNNNTGIGSNSITNMFTINVADYIRNREMFRMFTCSPIDGVWGGVTGPTFTASMKIFSFDTNSPIATSPATIAMSSFALGTFEHIWFTGTSGTDEIYMLEFAGNNITTLPTILRQNNTTTVAPDVYSPASGINITDYQSLHLKRSMKCILSNGMIISGGYSSASNQDHLAAWVRIMAVDFSDPLSGDFNRLIWDNYGWDGAAWVLNHAGSKPTHGTSDSLPDGLAISFDDNSGANTFVATDHYTTGIVDGVLLDGATEFTHTHDIYFKPTVFGETTIESPILPNAQQTLSVEQPLVWQDVLGTPTLTPTSFDHAFQSSGARSTNVIPAGSDGQITLEVSVNTSTNSAVYGFSNIAKVGTAINASTIDYGVRVRSIGSGNFSIDIIENGVVKLTPVDSAGAPTNLGQINAFQASNYPDHHKITIKRIGTTISYNVLGEDIYTSLIPSNTDLVFDTAHNIANYGAILNNIAFVGPITSDFIKLGDGISTGSFDPNFRILIPNETTGKFSCIIDGSQATQIGIEDSTTPLGVGEISVFDKAGAIRFSPLDIGKSISASYTYLQNI